MCLMRRTSTHTQAHWAGDFIMHGVELLIWHCAEFTIYHGNITLVSTLEQQRYHYSFSHLRSCRLGRSWAREGGGSESSC